MSREKQNKAYPGWIKVAGGMKEGKAQTRRMVSLSALWNGLGICCLALKKEHRNCKARGLV